MTPCSLIRGIITELGVIEPEIRDVENVSRNSDSVIPVANFLQRKLLALNNENGRLSNYHRELLERVRQAVTPIATPIGYQRMDTERLIPYLLTQEKLLTLLSIDTTIVRTPEDLRQRLQVKEVGDGNLNFVYIISHGDGDENHRLVIKQALPYVRCVGEAWPLTLQRAAFEFEALEAERASTNGKYVPEVYHFDRTNCLIAMRYIEPPHLILRKQLIQCVRLSTVAEDLGVFLAQTLFKSSGLHLSGGELRKNVSRWSENIALCALTEKVIFTDPYTAGCPLNRCTVPYVSDYAEAITKDTTLKLAASHWKQVFITNTQALLHGDLHTGSVSDSCI